MAGKQIILLVISAHQRVVSEASVINGVDIRRVIGADEAAKGIK
jgi:hypothetical protein